MDNLQGKTRSILTLILHTCRDVMCFLMISTYIVSGLLNEVTFAVMFALTAVLMVLDFKRFKKLFTKEKIFIIFGLFIFVGVRALAFFFEYGDLSIFHVVDQFKTAFAMIIILYYSNNNKIEVPKWQSISFIVLVFVVCLRTSITLLIHPNLSRMMATGNFTTEINTFLVASYDNIYGFVFLDLYFLYSLMSFKQMNIKEKFIFPIMFLLLTITIFLASFTLALLFVFVGAFLLIHYLGKKRLFISIIVIMFVGMYPLGFLLVIAGRLITNPWFSERIIQVGLMLIGQVGTDSEIYDRISRVILSFTTAFNDPIVGVGAYYQTLNMATLNIGGHSTLADELARYGFPMFFIFLGTFVAYFNYLKKSNSFHLSFYQGILLFLLALLNPITYSGLLVYPLIIVPILYNTFGFEKTNPRYFYRQFEFKEAYI